MKHPFAQEAIEKKYAYVISVAMVVFENGEVNEKQEAYLKKLVRDIGLKDEDLNKILKIAGHYQRVKNKVISVLDTPYKKYCFLMELYNMFYETNEKDKNLIKGITEFAELLNIKETEIDSVKQVYLALGSKHKQYLAEMTKRFEIEQSFLGEELLEYFTSEESFSLHAKEILHGKKILQQERVLQKGEELIITKAYQIMGQLKVLKGARLIFDGAQVEMHATIQVEGGYLEIKNSSFKVNKEMNSAAFLIKNAIVHIQDSKFDGNGMTGIWCHIDGELFIQESIFLNTSNRPGITLWDCPANIKKSQFIGCKAETNNGGAIYTNSNLEVLESTFENCRAYRGAAIYRCASIIPWVKEEVIKTSISRTRQNEESKMLQVFGQKINFTPIPKSFNRIAYPIILRHNKFLNCKGYKMGVVCAYKSQVIINEENIFDKCEGQSIYYYE